MTDLSVEFPDQILAICDADYDHLIGTVQQYNKYSIFITDYHDAETLMANSPALLTFIQEYSTNSKLELMSKSLLNEARKSASVIGLLRWVNSAEELKLNFKGLNFNEFTNISDFSIEIELDVLVDSLIRRSINKLDYVDKSFLIEKIEEYKQKEGCLLQVCCGHDLTNVIAMVYRNKWASLETNMDVNKVEAGLRIGYQADYFYKTTLAKNINAFLSERNIDLQAC